MKWNGHQLILSRRNLLTLLHKLDVEGSTCTIMCTEVPFVVTSQPDHEHYAEREPGRVSEETETWLAKQGGVKAPERVH